MKINYQVVLGLLISTLMIVLISSKPKADDLSCLSEAIYFESRSESFIAPITPALRKYATQLFPDITDEMIRRNYNELLGLMENRRQINGFYIKPRMNKMTGWIEWWPIIPAKLLHSQNRQPKQDSWNKIGEEVKQEKLPF